MLARSLHADNDVIGIDHRGARHIPKNVSVHAIDVRRRQAEDVFRRNRIDAVIHLRAAKTQHRGDRRLATVESAARVLDLCERYEVPKVVIVSTALVYGPNPDNDQFLTEDCPPLTGQRFTTMRDRVEIDMYASTFFWRYPEADVVLLRPVAVVGRLDNAPSRYLGLSTVPTVLGFDPMIQVIAPIDVLHAVQLSLKPGVRGVFNIAGPGPAPLSAVIRRLGRRALPVPEPIFRRALATFAGIRRSAVPRAEVDYLKYICLVDDSRAREALGYEHSLSLERTLDPLRA